MRLLVTPEAEELAEAAQWYEARRAGLGAQLVASVDAAFDAISAAPLSFAVWREDRTYRRRVLDRFP